MSIASQLVELHGGSIRAASAGLGEGATFTVRLPVMVAYEPRTREADPDGEPAPGIRSLSGLDVLAVDNEADARELLVALLGNAGAHVRVAGSVGEALALYQAKTPQVIVSDIEMEGGDGYALIRRVREIEQASAVRTPAIALSARTRAADRLRALSAGFQLHLPKPVDPVELVVAIASLAGLQGR
jgi:CheY-like chemotaxis protein